MVEEDKICSALDQKISDFTLSVRTGNCLRNANITNIRDLVSDQNFDVIDQTITELAEHKHGKISSDSINTVRPIQIIANISYQIFSKYYFGYFENVQKQKFSKEYTGRFRIAHGRLPFFRALKYKGFISFSDSEAVILDPETGKLISLQPLIFWDSCDKHRDIPEGHCFFYDKYDEKENTYSYKAVGFNCTCKVSQSNEYCVLADQVDELRKEDRSMELTSNGIFESIESV